MKKPIMPSPTPQMWAADALLAKAQRYVERMAEEDSEGWEHALWSSLALELLARAALSNVSPALLADQSDRNWNNLFHSLGFTPTEMKFSPKSIPTQEVLKRLREILPEFNRELESFCVLHTGRRNAELHSGETPYDGIYGSTWHPPFYRACAVLLASMGLELEEFVGSEEAQIAEKLIAAAADETAKAVLGDVDAHRKVWLAKRDEERKGLSAAASAWATKQAGHRVNCPACESLAMVMGEPIAAPQKTLRDDEITEIQEYLPSRFECIGCSLKISGLSRLSAVNLGTRYRKTQVYEAAAYYAPEDEFAPFEDDNNEPG